MTKGWSKRNRKPQPPHHPPHKITYNIDRFTINDLRQGKARQETLSHLNWELYSELAYQRSKRKDEITKALTAATVGPHLFSKYQRVVRYKWALNPLSVAGSIKDIGGRFNIGDIDPARFQVFPALYLGEDKNTSLQELLQGDPVGKDGLNSQELALMVADSLTFVSVFGSLESIIDLYQPERLTDFVNVIKDFKYSSRLTAEMKKEGLTEETVVKSVEGLLSAIYDEAWRGYPMHYDIPSGSQIFGQLVSESGIEGIRYKSKYTEKPCFALFPQNFMTADSFVEIMDQCPPGARKRLDEKFRSEKG